MTRRDTLDAGLDMLAAVSSGELRLVSATEYQAAVAMSAAKDGWALATLPALCALMGLGDLVVSPDGDAVLVALPDGRVARMPASDPEAAVEASRQSPAIVVAAAGTPSRLRWDEA